MESLNFVIQFIDGNTPLDPTNPEIVNSSNTVATGDGIFNVILMSIMLLLAVWIAFVMYRKSNPISQDRLGSHVSAAYMSRVNFCSMATKVLTIAIPIIAIITVSCILGTKAFANQQNQIKDDANVVYAKVFDDKITIDSYDYINVMDQPIIIDQAVLEVSDECAEFSELEESILQVKGFDGVLYHGKPDGAVQQPTDINRLEPHGTTTLTFNLDNIEYDLARKLIDKSVYNFSIHPAYVDNKIELAENPGIDKIFDPITEEEIEFPVTLAYDEELQFKVTTKLQYGLNKVLLNDTPVTPIDNVYTISPAGDAVLTIVTEDYPFLDEEAGLLSEFSNPPDENASEYTITNISFVTGGIEPPSGYTAEKNISFHPDTSDAAIWVCINAGKTDMIIWTKQIRIYSGYKSCASLFSDFSSLTNITNLDKFDTSFATDMNSMFKGCSVLNQNGSALDLSTFNTELVKDMSSMFEGMKWLKAIDVSEFNTSKVTDMSSMFKECSQFNSLDLSSFKTSNVTDMSSMFAGCSSVTGSVGDELIISSFDTKSVTDMSSMFEGMESIRAIDVSSFITSKVTDMTSMFEGMRSLTAIDVSSFITSKVTDMTSMFEGMQSLNAIDVSKFDTSLTTSMKNMFKSCMRLKALDVTSFKTTNVTDMSYMFAGCSIVAGTTAGAQFNLSQFNTTSVTNMSHMFEGMQSIRSIDISNFDTTKVKDMSYMFSGCISLVGKTSASDPLDLSSFNTALVENMSYMFNNCKSLVGKLDLSSNGWNLKKVTSLDYMFYGCESVTEITFNSNDLTSSEQKCSSNKMFYNCSSLKTIWTTENANWTSAIKEGTDMFAGCTKLQGGIFYDASKVGPEYACTKTGYFDYLE